MSLPTMTILAKEKARVLRLDLRCIARPRPPVGAKRRRIHAAEIGSLLATVLHGAWRAEPPKLGVSVHELAEITPFLLKSGEGALAWWRLRGSPLADSQPARALRQALRRQALHALVHHGTINAALTLVRDAGVEPVLGKGWAVARLYPHPALRPRGDIDLFVSPEAHGRALAAVQAAPAIAEGIDLHRGFAELDDVGADALYARSRLVPLGAEDVRVFGEEDHLRLLCLHMFRHGAFRPLWLCDVALALECRSSRFDWDVFLGGDPRRADRAVCALVLSHELLGARLDGMPLVIRRRALPRWIVPTVLRQWGASGFVPHGLRTPFRACLRAPAGALSALRERWPNGIEATISVDGGFNDLPRLPFQIADCVRRAARFAGRRPRLARQP